MGRGTSELSIRIACDQFNKVRVYVNSEPGVMSEASARFGAPTTRARCNHKI